MGRGRSTFVPNPAFRAAAFRSRELGQTMRSIAEDAAAIASDLAPDDPETFSGEDLAGSIRGEVILGPDGFRGRVLAMNYKGLFWEFGTSTNEARPFLRPALEQMGLEVGPPDQEQE